jgi:hypothetical protein
METDKDGWYYGDNLEKVRSMSLQMETGGSRRERRLSSHGHSSHVPRLTPAWDGEVVLRAYLTLHNTVQADASADMDKGPTAGRARKGRVRAGNSRYIGPRWMGRADSSRLGLLELSKIRLKIAFRRAGPWQD